VNFQSYLLEGLASWNEDRATSDKQSAPRSGDHQLRFALNMLGRSVLGTELYSGAKTLRVNTGKQFLLYVNLTSDQLFHLKKCG